MYKLLINCPQGEQQIIKIGEGGSYFDMSLVIWDERTDGKLPDDITLGKMRRNGKALETLPDYLPDHAAFVAALQAKTDQQTKKTQLETDTKSDGDLALLRAMSGTEIDDWFTANVTNSNQAIRLLKKVVKTLARKDLL